MKLKLAYGKGYLDLELPDSSGASVVKPNSVTAGRNQAELVCNALQSPINSRTLTELALDKNAANAVIVVNDITRPTPYQVLLPPLLQELHEAGIKPENIILLVALGIHRPHTDEENRMIFGEEICNRYRIESHNCDDHLKFMGYLSNGMELVINRTAAEADLLITTGLVNLHYFAGYSGGRKSILPGIAARELISANHQMMSDERACLGNYTTNPVSDIMLEAAELVGVDFIINVVTAGHNEIAYAAAGHLYDAWLSCVQYCEEANVVKIKQQADIVVASCGGYPKDINVYQAQKALDAAVLAVKEGGTIILAAECSEGLGEDTFEEWINTAQTPQDILERFDREFQLGGHKAFAICRALNKARIVLVSSLGREAAENMFLVHAAGLGQALKEAMERYGPDASIIVMPEASKTGIRMECFE